MPTTPSGFCAKIQATYRIWRPLPVSPERPPMPVRAMTDSALPHLLRTPAAVEVAAGPAGPTPPRPPAAGRRTSGGNAGRPSRPVPTRRNQGLQRPAIAPLPPYYAYKLSTRETALLDLEQRIQQQMGTWALRGLRHSIAGAIALSSAVGLGFGIASLITPMVPFLGLALFVGFLLGGVVVGFAGQTLARRRWLKHSPGPGPLLAEIEQLRAPLAAQKSRTGAEIQQLRRLEVLALDVRGGLRHSLWQVFSAVTGLDPRLRGMLRTAVDGPGAPGPARAEVPLAPAAPRIEGALAGSPTGGRWHFWRRAPKAAP